MKPNEIPDDPREDISTPQEPASSINQNRMNEPSDMPGQMNTPQTSIPITRSEGHIRGAIQNQPTINAMFGAEQAVPPKQKQEEPHAEETWFLKADADEMRSRWNTIQIQFVESPCTAVEQGDALIGEVMERFSQMLSDHQESLNQQWINHDDITTEELRMTLLNYRILLEHLLKL
ncbi:MAG: hypothetical protein C3F13_12895 [Anaerolineales bacterium]|nr:hypothetical protein [Anaerolineae bacterium]PWB51801.1 MAG: hypothetical protein C3F13_12895 [Anaerolineales bacterium]